jgi:hypothetical protein
MSNFKGGRFSLRRILSIIILASLGLLVLALVGNYLHIGFLILIFLSSIIWLASKSSSYRSSKILKNILDWLRGCLIFLFATGIFVSYGPIRNAIDLGSLRDHVREYSTVSGLKNPARTSPHQTEAYLKGKIITVNKKEKRLDDIYFDLPEELRATKPEDVGTIVWLEWGKDEAGFYCDWSDVLCKDGITPPKHDDPATVNTCHVTIIDKFIPAIVGEMSFMGSDPPQRKTRSGSSSGSMPTEEIVAYLQSLPKK